MKKILLLFMLGAMALVSCEEAGGDDAAQSLSIEVESGGGVYTFGSTAVDVVSEPNSYYAEVENNTIVGNYAGSTTATVVSGGVRYNCDITVSPSYTYYVDMAIYVGASKATIESLYGSSISSSGDVCLYEPLSSYFPEKAVAFIYENDKVVCAASYFKIYQGSYVLKHLNQRYYFIGIDDSVAYYMNAYSSADCTLAILYNYSSTSYTFVMYSEYSYSSASSTRSGVSNAEAWSTALHQAIEMAR
ncbi:MAG: hypothetical protein SNH16_02760 [Rikenellaceae bacterium]